MRNTLSDVLSTFHHKFLNFEKNSTVCEPESTLCQWTTTRARRWYYSFSIATPTCDEGCDSKARSDADNPERRTQPVNYMKES